MIPDYTKQIWSWFKQNTQLTDAGISAVMGNMWAESNCEPCRRQGDFSEDRHISKDYSDSVDNGTKSVDVFAKDKYGFGLCQWTFWTRKAALYSFCVEKNKSISDLTAQLEFTVKELKSDFVSVYNLLCSSDNVRLLCDEFMVKFEIPYDQSDGAKLVRSNKSQEYYNKFHGSDVFDAPILDDVETPSSSIDKALIASKLEQVTKLVGEVLDAIYDYL